MSDHTKDMHAAALEADRAEAAALALARVARDRAIALETALQAAARAARLAVALAARADQAAIDLDHANTDVAQATVLAGERAGDFARLALLVIADRERTATE